MKGFQVRKNPDSRRGQWDFHGDDIMGIYSDSWYPVLFADTMGIYDMMECIYTIYIYNVLTRLTMALNSI